MAIDDGEVNLLYTSKQLGQLHELIAGQNDH